MPERTTVIVLLLAGNDYTAGLMDALLKEIYDGVSAWTAPNPPDVFCFYHRRMGKTERRTYSYPLCKGFLTFHGTALDVSHPHYPPPHHHHHTGELADQIDEFFSRLPKEGGPVRLVIGAHGNPPAGFNTYLLLAKIWILWRLLLSPLDTFLNRMSWRDRLEYLRNQVTPTNDPPDGFAVRSGPKQADLKVDRVAAALCQLNQERLQTLILHTCTGSAVEIISALDAFPHQIACESVLTGQPMVFSNWFRTLGDPDSSPEQITFDCFQTLESAKHPQGCFSSYRTAGLNLVLEKLDDLGAELLTLMKKSNNQATIEAICEARSSANLTGTHNDLALFCSLLQPKQIVPDELLEAIICSIRDMLVVPAKLIVSGRLPTGVETQWVGIGFYLAIRRANDFDLSHLPQSFRDRAPNWLKFLACWQR